jgi:hypothetical protein
MVVLQVVLQEQSGLLRVQQRTVCAPSAVFQNYESYRR